LAFWYYARRARKSFTHNQILDGDAAIGQALFITAQNSPGLFELHGVAGEILRLGENRENFLLHARDQRRRIVTPQFEAAHLERAVFRNGEKTMGTGTSSNCRDGRKHDVAIDRLDRQRQLRARGDFRGERFVLDARRSRFPHVQ